MEKIEHESIEAAVERKQSHLDLASASQNGVIDQRFYYEPMISGHSRGEEDLSFQLGKKSMNYPMWISSMTGGSSKAGAINKMLAKSAGKFGLGMGLGSCRIILEDATYFDDFNLRPILGDAVPFYANVGIAQIERLIAKNQAGKLKDLVLKLDADGLIVHVNPLQEWLQPEGDMILHSPLETIQRMLNEFDLPVIVKEVGQGFGPESMRELLKLPILALDFAANGGTNFAKLELIRNERLRGVYEDVVSLGHDATEMVECLNDLVDDLKDQRKCAHVIISGGVKNFLDGYYLTSKCILPAVYGQAAPFLKHANESQEALDEYIQDEIRGLRMAHKFLKLKR